jgi:ABC-type transport system involved in multi-copper enzyme maturation permease subunit
LLWILETVVAVWPDMTYFTVTTQVTYGMGVPSEYVGHATLYAAGYLLVLLATGSWIFQRRDFI